MEAVASTLSSSGWLARAEQLTEESIGKLTALCDAILMWHRSNFMFREPSEKERRDMKEVLKLILRFLKVNHLLLSEPDGGTQRLAAAIAARISQLEDAYEYTFNPLPESEARELLNQHFPDEQGAGGAG